MSEVASLEARLADVLRGPEAIGSQLLFRVARPLLALASWRAAISASALEALVTALRAEGTASPELVAAARKELEANVAAVERVTIVQRQAPVAHALWLRRACSVLALVARAEPHARRLAARTDPGSLFAPLVPLQQEHRLVDVELAAVDHLMAAARAETTLLGRRRRLLVAARQRLLEVAAALPIARAGVKDRTRWLAQAITRVDRLEAAGLSADVSLVYQARQALARGDRSRLYASLAAIDAHALAAGDAAMASRTQDVLGPRDAAGSVASSGAELLGPVTEAIASAVSSARVAAITQRDIGGGDRATADSFLAYLPEDADAQLVRAAVAADGLFEVGGALTPVRVFEEERVQRLVRHPTEALVLTPAEDVRDLPDAIVADPRTVLLDLAIGRLFARRFVSDEVVKRPKIVRRGEVRVYLLDGSGSMEGARARVRDALLVAELSTLMRRLSEPGDVDCTLHFRFFDELVRPVTRVATVAEATAAIRDVVSTRREGGTDIQAALLASLVQVAEARLADPSLAQAQIVLVTDGEAFVDEATLLEARAKITGLPIGISVIALGEENAALRGIVARQRAKGERAFYHFLDDDELAEVVAGTTEEADAIHPPVDWEAVLAEETADLVDELERIERAREAETLETLEAETQARRELGVVDDANDGARARLEALRKDRVALGARFDRWFPEPEAGNAALPPEKTKEREDLDAAACALASVAEVVTLLGGTPVARQADAIELLERLLPDAHLRTADYRALVQRWPAGLAPGLRAVRAATR